MFSGGHIIINSDNTPLEIQDIIIHVQCRYRYGYS